MCVEIKQMQMDIIIIMTKKLSDGNMKPYLKTGPQLTIIFTIDPSADYFLN